MSLSREDLRIVLDETRVGPIKRFRIDFKPRLGFQLLSEERIILLARTALAATPEWTLESVAFLPVDGDPKGFKVAIAKRIQPVIGGALTPFVVSSAFAITALVAATAVISVLALVYTVHKLTPLGSAVIEGAPGAVGELASGFRIGALAALAGVGFFIYKAVTQ